MSQTYYKNRRSSGGYIPVPIENKYHRLNPEMVMELKESNYPNHPCDNSDYTPNNSKK